MNGVEWIVDVHGCRTPSLTDPETIVALFESIVARAGLRPIGRPVWHQFPTTGGITAIWMLQESHLTIHTFPEYASASLNLFCCTPRPRPDWPALLEGALGASALQIQECARTYGAAAAAGHHKDGTPGS